MEISSEISETPSCSDLELGSPSSGEYLEHGADEGSCNAGDALFAAFCGSGASAGSGRQNLQARPQHTKSVQELLLAAARVLSQGDEAGSEADGEAPAKVRRQSTRITEQRAIAARYAMARDTAPVTKGRYWAAEWAMREYPEMCRTRKERKQFLRKARRWSKNLRRGLYGSWQGLTVPEQSAGLGAAGTEGTASSQGPFERHRSGHGSATVLATPSKRRRLSGGGGPGRMKVPCIGEELFAWFVDTLTNVKGRLPSCLLLQRAELIAKDLAGIHQQQIEAGSAPPHAKMDLPVLNHNWLRRWRRTYGVSARQANLRFKAPRHVIQFRLRVFWCNVIRVRVLHALLEPGGELLFEGFDQKPMWFTASSQEKTLALRGARKVAVKENVPMTRARFTVMTRCRWPSPPEDGKEIAVLFKAAGGGSRIREALRVPPEVLLQFQEKGSYRLPDVLTYISWILDRSRGPPAGGPAAPGPPASSQGSAPPGPSSGEASASSQGGAAALSQKGLQAPPGPKSGRRVVYLLDWFSPHLDTNVDTLVHSAGHAVLRIGGHLTGLVQVEDTHAHGPMTAAYKKQEILESYAQLEVRPERLPSTSRQTVLDRALDSWRAVNHMTCSRGFVSNGIANKLDGSEDCLLTLDVKGYWDSLDMPRLRAKVIGEVAKAVEEGTVTSFADYQTLLESYDDHAGMWEGQEAFGVIDVDGDVVGPDATDDDDQGHEGDDGDNDDAPPGGGGGRGGGGPPCPAPAAPPHPPAAGETDGSAEVPDCPPPLPPPPGGPGSGGSAAAVAAPAASSQVAAAPAASSQVCSPPAHPFMEEAAQQLSESLKQRKMAIESAMQAVAAVGGDRDLEESLRIRLREVDKKMLRSGDPTRTSLRAVALERQAKVDMARAESNAEEARAKELKLLVELRKHEAEIAKAKSKEAAVAAKAALETAKKEKDEAARLRAKAEDEDRRLRAEFAAALAGQLHEYLNDCAKGKERTERCHKLALKQARMKAGLQKIDVPVFWSPTTSGMRQLVAEGARVRLRAKSEILYASPEFTWVLLGRQKYGQEGKWTAHSEPRYLFRRLVEQTMPGYLDVLGCRYGTDNLLAESRNILDLAFVAANWRYTRLVDQRFYRSGLAGWPCREAWWTSKLASAEAAAAAAASGAAATGPSAGHGGCSSACSAAAAGSGFDVGVPSCGAALPASGSGSAGASSK